MFKQVFNKENGKVKLVKDFETKDNGELVFDYDEEKYTDKIPPSDIYDPIYFDDKEEMWHGLTKSEWKKEREKNESDNEISASKIEQENAEMQFMIFETQKEIEELRKENSEIIEEIVSLKGDK